MEVKITSIGFWVMTRFRFAIVSLWCLVAVNLHAQNLVPNHSFEIYDPCPPPEVGMGGPLESSPWISAGPGTADYFNRCASPMWRGVPKNFQGYQNPYTGDAYAGVYVFVMGNQYREYISAPLLDTLEEGLCYKGSAWVNFANQGCGADQFGLLFTADIPNPLGMFPQIAWAGGTLGDSVTWTNVLGYFVATGDEMYITLGNCRPDAETHKEPGCPGPYAYYYIDEVQVEEVPFGQASVDLGPDVVVCDSFTIVAGDDPDVVYVWSTGEQGPEITVYTSGTYSVTASYACDTDFDEIEVIIPEPGQVDIGPDAIMLCAGDVFEISLDPDAGDYLWQDGTDDPDYTISTAGTYSVTLDDGCHTSSDMMVVTTVDIPASFSLGNDTILCDGQGLTINLDPTLGEFEWQDGSGNASYTIDEEGTYALTISNMCGEQSDEIEVQVILPPSVYLGEDALLCSSQFIEIQLDPDMGEYIWLDGSTDSDYVITEDGLYSVTVTNSCGADEDQIVVMQGETPAIELGPDIQGCPGDTFILDPGIIDGEYTWQDNTTTPIYTVTTSGTYELTVTNACGTDSDLIDVTYSPAITPPDLGPDLSICPGDQVVLMVSDTEGDILWNDFTANETLVVTAGGTYFVQVSTACENYSDTIVITLNNNAPALQLPADFSLCSGDTTILLAGIAGVNYLWNDGSNESTLSVSAPGWYSLTVSNSCGSSSDSILISAGEAAPMVSLGSDTTVCPGESIVIVPAFTNVATWTWNDGSATPDYTVTSPGILSIQAANSCATATDTVVISLLPQTPQLDLGPDVQMCPGESVTLSINLAEVGILWSDGSSGNDLVVTDSAEIYATITNACGQNADTVQIDLLPETPSLDLGQDQTICPGEIVTFDPGIAGVSYLWHDGSENPTYSTTQGETIYLTITGVCGSSTDTVIITESNQGPQVNLGPDVSACQGEIITLDAGISGVQYVWQDGSMMDELVVTQPGKYSITVSNACGTDMDTVEVMFTPLPLIQNLGPDTTLCEGLTLVLSAQASPGTMVLWQDMSALHSFMVSLPGKYYVTAFNQCGEESDTIHVEFLDAPDPFYLGPDTTICPGEVVLLSAPSVSYELLWQDGSSMPEQVADQAGWYWLKLSNECGAQSDTVVINLHSEDPVLNLEPEVLWCPGDQFLLNASQPFDATYLWSTGALTPSITVNTPGIYRVEVTTVCITVEDQTEVIPEDNCDVGGDPVFYIPNVFSPNEDGINDQFTVITNLPENVLSMEGSIYDRWGNLVFGSTEKPFAWDGRFGDTPMNPGVYVYVVKIRYTAIDGEREEVFHGDVTVVR